MNLLKYTAKLGGVLLIFMGILTFTSVAKTGLSNNKTANESTKETTNETVQETTEVAKNESKAENAESTSAAESKERNQTATTHKDTDTSNKQHNNGHLRIALSSFCKFQDKADEYCAYVPGSHYPWSPCRLT